MMNMSESGFVERSGAGSSIQDYFNDFLPSIERVLRRTMDPTIDLNGGPMAICAKSRSPPSHRSTERLNAHQHGPQQQQQRISLHSSSETTNIPGNNGASHSGRTFTVACADVSLHELNLIVDSLKANNSYSHKLANIMLKDLAESLGDEVYRTFLGPGLPKNFLPIVKMNDDNTPHVEFIVKSNRSEQDPYSQVQGYTPAHMAYAQYVIDYLRRSANNGQLVASEQQSRKQLVGQSILRSTNPTTTSLAKAGPMRTIEQQKRARASLPLAPMCSTPLNNKQQPAMRRNSQPAKHVPSDFDSEILNDSKRRNPIRACKSNPKKYGL